MVLFEVLTVGLTTPTSILSSSTIHTFSAAGAGTIATLVTHPFDVIKVASEVISHYLCYQLSMPAFEDEGAGKIRR